MSVKVDPKAMSEKDRQEAIATAVAHLKELLGSEGGASVAGSLTPTFAQPTPQFTRAQLMKELTHEVHQSSISTQRQYKANVYDYFEWLKGRGQEVRWAERDILYDYMAHLQKGRHLKQSAVDYIVRSCLGCLFRIAGLRLPVKLPKVKSPMLDVASRKSFTQEEITALIKTAKESGDAEWQNMMVLSSTYGLRAGELRVVSKSDVHPNKKTIVIQTEKGGMLREHLVPPQIADIVLHYDYPPMGRQRVFDVFNAIAEVAGVDRGSETHKKGLHAVRHGVMTIMKYMRNSADELVYDEKDLYVFFRWKGGSILSSYSTPNFTAEDKVIFKHHPFLDLWV